MLSMKSFKVPIVFGDGRHQSKILKSPSFFGDWRHQLKVLKSSSFFGDWRHQLKALKVLNVFRRSEAPIMIKDLNGLVRLEARRIKSSSTLGECRQDKVLLDFEQVQARKRPAHL